MYVKLLLIASLLLAAAASGQVTLSGDLYDHVDSIITTLPGDETADLDKYVEPTTTQQTQWQAIIQDMLDTDYASAHSLAASLNYRVVEFTDTGVSPAETYYILERLPGETADHWGTFVFNPSPSRSHLVIQAPHPLQNRYTGNQGIRVFATADCWIYCVAGTHKCNASGYSSCDGTSTSCSATSEPYRVCDQAHAEFATFELTTSEILSEDPNAIIIQPHGYTKGAGGPDDPDIIMSNGSTETPPTSYLVDLRDNLASIDNTLTFKVAHIDTDYDFFLGRENIQGRTVNGAADPCDDVPPANTGNFIHLEQAYEKLRDTEANWMKLATAVAMAFSPDVQISSAQSGSWTDGATWVGGIVPTNDDDVFIDAGHVISVDDNSAECLSLTFGDTASHIDMNADCELSVYGDFTLFSEDHNVFSAGWSGTNAYIRFAGSAAVQTLSGWSTSGGSTSFRDIIIDKTTDGIVTTDGSGMRFAVQNSMEIISGIFKLEVDDDLEARWASSGSLTGNQNLEIIVREDGQFRLVDGTGSHWVRSQTGSTPIGKMTIYGYAEFTDASSSDISLQNIDVMAGGTLEVGLGLGSTTYGPEFNPGTVTVEADGEIMSVTTSDIWFDTSVVVLNTGATYKTTGSSTVFPATFTNNGKVRYQRDPATASDQEVVDTDYYDVEFSFDGSDHLKQWELTDNRAVADSLTVNNSADVILTAASPFTLAVAQAIRLTSGTLDNSDANVTIEVADGSLISRATGTMAVAPSFAGVVDLRYSSSSSSVTTGPEMPTASGVLRDMAVYSNGQIVTLGNDATLNGTLTLSLGTFDNDGDEDDFTFTLADGAGIRRATGELSVAPAFAGGVDVEYISTVSQVTTGNELPTGAGVLSNLTITGDQGVILGADVSVNGDLALDGSDLTTDTYTVTLADGASLYEDFGFTVKGNLAVTRTMSQGFDEDFGGVGIELNAGSENPGVTTVTRVTSDPQTIDGSLGISRYFDITAATNSGLGATMVFHYDDNELNGINEDSLALYSSTDGGSAWAYRGGVVDGMANTVTLSGISSFSRWTLGGAALEGQATSFQSGSWTDPATWVGGQVPDTSADVLIVTGHTVSVDDTLAVCGNLNFGGDDALIDMNAKGRLTIYGDMTLFSETHNVFSAGWSSDSAYVYLMGSNDQTLAGWSTSGGSTSFRDLVIAKDSGSVVTTAGSGMRLAVQNSLHIQGGSLLLAADDDFEARWASSGNLTGNQLLEIVIDSGATFELEDGSGTHWVRSQTGSTPIGLMTIYGEATFADASSSDISIGNIDVKAGGQLTLSTGLGSTTYGPEFNPGTITIDSGGVVFTETTSEIYFDTSIVILSRGGLYKTTSATTVLPPTFVNDGRVRYQRNPSTATTDQEIVDIDYYDIEFSFNGNSTRKLWTLTGNRLITDSLEVNNSAEVIISGTSGEALTVDSTLRLTSGSLDVSDANVTLELADGALVSRATGSMTGVPSFAGVVDVRYTSSVESVTTGPELPAATDVLRDLTVYSTDQTVTLNDDVTVNGDLTLSVGIFDNDGLAGDKVLSLANSATIRRATGELTAAPNFGDTVDVEYISTVGPVVTGVELPTALDVLGNLSIIGNMGVTLGADVTINGSLHLADSILSTATFAATLSSTATIVEDSIWVVQGRVQTTRTLAQSVEETFGGLGLSLTALGAAPGATAVARVTGESQTVGGNASVLRRYEISPAVNTGLNATVVLSYADSELNGATELDMVVYRSVDAGASWEAIGGVVDDVANTVTVTGIDNLGWLTLGGPSNSCCVGDAGNVNFDPADNVDISDLTKLVNHLFVTFEPLECPAEGNTNGDAGCAIDISDLTKLVNHLFVTFESLAPCQPQCGK